MTQLCCWYRTNKLVLKAPESEITSFFLENDSIFMYAFYSKLAFKGKEVFVIQNPTFFQKIIDKFRMCSRSLIIFSNIPKQFCHKLDLVIKKLNFKIVSIHNCTIRARYVRWHDSEIENFNHQILAKLPYNVTKIAKLLEHILFPFSTTKHQNFAPSVSSLAS